MPLNHGVRAMCEENREPEFIGEFEDTAGMVIVFMRDQDAG